MNKKILLGVVIGGMITSAAYAYGGDCPDKNKQTMNYKRDMQHKSMSCKDGKYGQYSKYSKYKGKMSSKSMYKKRRHRDYFAKMFKRLDLTKKQRFEISILNDEMKLELKKLRGFAPRKGIFSYIGENGFDAATYKKDIISMSEKRIGIRADYMAKMFKVLTKEQIDKLKKGFKH